jgi:hypothetical protein
MKNLINLLIINSLIIVIFISASNPENDIKILKRTNRVYDRVAFNSEIAISILNTQQIPSNVNNYSFVYYKKGSCEVLKKIEIGKNDKLKVRHKNVNGMQSKLSTTVNLDSINSYCCEFLDDSYMGHKYEDYLVFKLIFNGQEKIISIYKQHIRENPVNYKDVLGLLNLFENEFSSN